MVGLEIFNPICSIPVWPEHTSKKSKQMKIPLFNFGLCLIYVKCGYLLGSGVGVVYGVKET
jgi:hypothetical protein